MSGNKKNSNEDFDASWIPVVILMVVCWPVGLFLLYRKLKQFSSARRTAQRRRSVTTVGGILLGMGALNLITRAFGGMLSTLFTALGGAALLGIGSAMKRRERLFQKYRAVAADRDIVDIGEFAAAIPASYEKAAKDLQDMIDEGLFGEWAYLDHQRMALVLDSRTAPPPDSKPQPQSEPRPQSRPEPQTEPQTEPQDGSLDGQFRAKVEEIRRANIAIQDEQVSADIQRIEDATASIFRLVNQRPEKLNQIHTFMNYYLPTTLKLLDAYSQLERQSVQGENIRSSKQNIEKMISQLAWAFEQQLDQMFEADARDISSDIKVLERMMAKDGLSENPYTLPRRPSQGAAQAVQRKPE